MNYKMNTKTSSRQVIYIDGNTVRRQDYYVAEPQQFTEERRKINRRINADVQKKPLGINLISVAGILLATMIVLLLCVNYVQMQTDIRIRVGMINELEDELAGLIAENKALENVAKSYIDLDYVYEEAVKMGMGYPKKDQIVYYEDENAEYVRQYGKISAAGRQ